MMNIIYAVAVLGVLGALWGAILAFASKVFAVEVDPREEAVLGCLAGANCGGCGYPGCSGYAAAIVAGEAPIDKCGPGGPEAAAKIGEIMGVGGAGCLDHFFHGGIRPGVADIIGDGSPEQKDFLGHDGDVFSEGFGFDLADVDAVQIDSAGDGIVHAGDQIGDGALSASRMSCNAYKFAFFY